MSRDYINIGPTPCEEECAQVGSENYRKRALAECRQYIEALRKVYGNEPEGAELDFKAHPHDFGSYYDVVCYYEADNEEAMKYAFKLETGLATWAEADMTAPVLS